VKSLLAVLILAAIAGAQTPAPAKRTVDKKFFAVAAFSAAALAIDGYTTARFVDRRTNCHETGEPMLLGRFPSPGRVAGISLAEFALGAALSYALKRQGRRILSYPWAAPVGYRGEVHLGAAIHNLNGCQ
jgi:hypothetical protein